MLQSRPAELADPNSVTSFRHTLTQELCGNILPFWLEHAVDQQRGGFHGAISNDLRVLNDAPRSAVLCTRILWTYAHAYRIFANEAYLAMAQRAYAYLTEAFWDQTNQGVFWLLDPHNLPLNDRKHSYAQAFAIYALSEYYAATADLRSLELAQSLFGLLEVHAYDDRSGGYFEGCGRDWQASTDLRLSEKEPPASKSMNTLLHIMEAYTNLLRVWPDERLRTRLKELIELFVSTIIDADTYHFRLFFDAQWNSLGSSISYGHDIEGSWLLVEAAELVGDRDLLAQVQRVAIEMAWSVYTQGLDVEGGLLYESDPANPASADKHWWVHAEAMIGFYNAYQLSGEARFERAAHGCWNYIEKQFIDREHGEWFKVLNRQGVPYPDQPKAGPWEDPYHHSRACFELLRRLAAPG